MHHLTHLLEIASKRAASVNQKALARDLMELAGIAGNYDPNDNDPMERSSGRLNDAWSRRYASLLKPRE
jgi:hypothetical protein